MASNLRVDQITASTTGSVSIGTATFTGSVSLPSGGVTVATGATISGSTNTITASTNGSERVRIDSNGDIGIAKSSPASWGSNIPTIEIKGTASTGGNSTRSGAIAFESGSGSNGYAVLWGQSGGIEIYTGATDRASATYRAKFNSTGNLAFASGNGIDFSATSDAGGMTSELLNDYEEGTWTPSVTNMTTTGSPAYGGRYRKIGSQVTVWFFTTTGSGVATYASTANSTNVTGLPYASGYDGPAQSGGPPGVAINGVTTAGGFIQGPISGGTYFYFDTSIAATQGMSVSLTYYV